MFELCEQQSRGDRNDEFDDFDLVAQHQQQHFRIHQFTDVRVEPRGVNVLHDAEQPRILPGSPLTRGHHQVHGR